jgi:hypothetical protein
MGVTNPWTGERAAMALAERLSSVSLRHYVDPDESITGHIQREPIVPAYLLSTSALSLDLSEEQIRLLAREETASIAQSGIRFECVLECGFAAQMATTSDICSPLLTYIFHEMGEETRHQRLFQRFITELAPKHILPTGFRLIQPIYRAVMHLSISFPCFFLVLVLAGEEIPDLFQRLACEAPEVDPLVREVSRYHRAEEARHISFAREILTSAWKGAGRLDRWMVRHVAPIVIAAMFTLLIHPGVYKVAGLPGWRTWVKVAKSKERQRLRGDCTRPVLEAVKSSGVFHGAGRAPKSWSWLCRL